MESTADVAPAKLGSGAPAFNFATEFPQSGFGATVRTACQVLGTGAELAMLRLTLGGFDTPCLVALGVCAAHAQGPERVPARTPA